MQELAFAKGLGKILAFYTTLVAQEGAEGNKNLVYHGNVVVNEGHHGIGVPTKTLRAPGAFKDASVLEIDMDRILVDFKEFALLMDELLRFPADQRPVDRVLA